MPIYSYDRYTSGGEAAYDITFDYLSSSHIEVYLDGVKQTSGYTIDTSTNKVTFTSAPSSGQIVLLQRATPKSKANFQSEIADFQDGSVLSETDLDNAVLGLLYISQEAEDSGSENSIGIDQVDLNWDAESKRIKNVATPSAGTDAVTKDYTDGLSLYNSPSVPQTYSFTATESQTEFVMSPAPTSADVDSFIVDLDGVMKQPTTDYTVSGSTLTLTSGASADQKLTIRNIGVARDILGENPTVSGNLNLLTGALQLAGSSAMQVMSITASVGTGAVSNVRTTTGYNSGNYFVTGNTITVTPKSTSSKFILLGSTAGYGTIGNGVAVQLVKGNTASGGSTTDGTTISPTIFSTKADSASEQEYDSFGLFGYCEPNTTSETKFDLVQRITNSDATDTASVYTNVKYTQFWAIEFV